MSDFYSDIQRQQMDKLNSNLANLNGHLLKSYKTSSKLQKWLIFWTIVMAAAVASQAILIGIQVF